MLRAKKSWIFIALIFLAACHRSPTRLQMLSSIVKAGIENPSFQSSSKDLEQLVASVRHKLSEAQANTLRDRLHQIVATNALGFDYESELQKSFSDAEIKEVYQFSQSSLNEKIIKASQYAKTTSGAYEIQIFQTEFKKKEPSAERKALVEEFMNLSGSAALSSKLMFESAEFFASLEPTPEKQRQALMGLQTSQIQTAVQEGVVLGSYFALRELSDSEIREYIRYLKSAGGSKQMQLNAALATKLNHALFSALRESLKAAKSN